MILPSPVLLLLTLCLVPVLVASVTLATRRWGPRIGGWLTAMPIIAGPTLCFYAVEQGTAFSARAAQATLVGLVAVVAHSVTYSWICRRWSWPASLLIAWLAFGAVTALFYFIQPSLGLSLVLALAGGIVAKRTLP